MLRVGSLVLNVKDARRASQFRSQALGYSYRDGGYNEDSTPVLLPHSATGIAVGLDEDDRTHLDLHTDSALEQQAEVERLVSLGATRVDWAYPDGVRFVVLADPEGNLFCVVNTGQLGLCVRSVNRGLRRVLGGIFVFPRTRLPY